MSRASYTRVQATVGVGTVLIWDFGGGGGGGYFMAKPLHLKNMKATQKVSCQLIRCVHMQYCFAVCFKCLHLK